jgi:hypothetical protein
VRQFVPTLDQQVCVILKIKIVDELLPFYVGFDIEVSVLQVIQFLRTLVYRKKGMRYVETVCVNMDPASVAKLFVGFP